jgi:hypothetical protein
MLLTTAHAATGCIEDGSHARRTHFRMPRTELNPYAHWSQPDQNSHRVWSHGSLKKCFPRGRDGGSRLWAGSGGTDGLRAPSPEIRPRHAAGDTHGVEARANPRCACRYDGVAVCSGTRHRERDGQVHRLGQGSAGAGVVIGVIAAACSLDTAGGMMTSWPGFQFAGVATVCATGATDGCVWFCRPTHLFCRDGRVR